MLRNELIRFQTLSVFFAELPSFAKPNVWQAIRGSKLCGETEAGFQSLEAGRGSVSLLAGTNAKCLEGNMTGKFDVIAIGTGSAASAVVSRCREADGRSRLWIRGRSDVPVLYGDATQRKYSSGPPKPLTGIVE
jgi:hypothetical protein